MAFIFPLLHLKKGHGKALDISDTRKLLKGKTCIVAEDNEINFRYVNYFLGKIGIKATWYKNGVDVIKAVYNGKTADLYLLDFKMPGMDGIEVLKTVKTYHPEIEVLIMSGHGTIDTAVQATKLGAFDFIEKPFDIARYNFMIFRLKSNALLAFCGSHLIIEIRLIGSRRLIRGIK